MKITKQMVMTMLSVLLGAILIGGSTIAYFSSTATSANNTFSAGTIELKDSTVAPFTVVNQQPGGIATNHTYTLKNTGSLSAKVSVTIDYTLNKGADNDGALDKAIIVSTLTYDEIDLLTANPVIFNKAADGDNTSLSLYDLKAAGKKEIGVIAAAGVAGEEKAFNIVFEFVNNGDQNSLQGDSITGASLVFEAMQQ